MEEQFPRETSSERDELEREAKGSKQVSRGFDGRLEGEYLPPEGLAKLASWCRTLLRLKKREGGRERGQYGPRPVFRRPVLLQIEHEKLLTRYGYVCVGAVGAFVSKKSEEKLQRKEKERSASSSLLISSRSRLPFFLHFDELASTLSSKRDSLDKASRRPSCEAIGSGMRKYGRK